MFGGDSSPIFFSVGASPCVPVVELLPLLSSFARLNLSVRSSSDPVVRYGFPLFRRVVDGDYVPLVCALYVWSVGSANSGKVMYGLSSAVRDCREFISRFGMSPISLYYLVRLLCLYLNRQDVVLLRRFIRQCNVGFLYFATKTVFSGRYVGRCPFDFQVEVAFTAPVFRVEKIGDEWCVCIDTYYLLDQSRRLLSDAGYLMFSLYGDEAFYTLVSLIIDEWECVGIEWVRSCFTWCLDRYVFARWVAIGIQKENLYGSFPVYSYVVGIVRDIYPRIGSEAVDMFNRGMVSSAESLFMSYIEYRRSPRFPPKLSRSALFASRTYSRLLEEAMSWVAAREAERRASVLRE